jgi:hypothetical protein
MTTFKSAALAAVMAIYGATNAGAGELTVYTASEAEDLKMY